MKRREFLRLTCGAPLLVGLFPGCRTTPKGGIVKLDGLSMPPFNTTLMGVLKGALDYYKLDVSAPSVFGLSGHAFLINIHAQLCPSGPYCWNPLPARALIANLGLRVHDLGFYTPGSSAAERATVEANLRSALDTGTACSLMNMENQLITGYDDQAFLTARPWVCNTAFPPATLSCGDWKELGKEYHISFFRLEKVSPAPRKAAILASLDYAADLQANPGRHSLSGYGVGPEAYAQWIAAAPTHGGEHGNWWNATVWSECRLMASRYMAELDQEYGSVSNVPSALRSLYAEIAQWLQQAADKELPATDKIALLEQARDAEAMAVDRIAALAATLRAEDGG